MIKTDTNTIQLNLNKKSCSSLTVLLNIELRSNVMSHEYAESLNNVFKELTGHDHENIVTYRK